MEGPSPLVNPDSILHRVRLLAIAVDVDAISLLYEPQRTCQVLRRQSARGVALHRHLNYPESDLEAVERDEEQSGLLHGR